MRTFLSFLSFVLILLSFIHVSKAEECAKNVRTDVSPHHLFAEANKLRINAASPEEKTSAELWMAIAMYRMQLLHGSNQAMNAIITKQVEDPQSKLVALNCIAEIQKKNPTLPIQIEAIMAFIKSLPKEKSAEQAVQRAMFYTAQSILSQEVPADRKVRLLSEFSKMAKSDDVFGIFLNFDKSLAERKHKEAAEIGVNLLAKLATAEELASYKDQIHLLTGRSYFTIENYKEAAKQYTQISKTSNLLPESLSELAWTYLKDEKFAEAIGASINVQSGVLRKTFTPEATMVQAMAFNELCLYPDSLRSAALFHKNYKEAHEWLDQWVKNPKAFDLYDLTIKQLKKKAGVPDKIASEWIRSGIFLSHQEELNRLIKVPELVAKVKKERVMTQIQEAKNIRDYIKKILPGYLKAKAKTAHGDKLPEETLNEVKELRAKVDTYRGLKSAAPLFKRMVNHQMAQAKARRPVIISQINLHLNKITQRMSDQLAEVADNTHFIRAEIYQEASEDIVWKNSNPEFDSAKAKIAEKTKSANVASNVWDWGKLDGGIEGSGEVWEDEIGAIQADLSNNCSNKDKFLSIKRQ